MLKPYQFYSFSLLLLAIASLIAGIWVIYKLDPAEALQNIVYFYASTGLFVLTSTALVLLIIRQRFGVREMVQRHFMVSLRQATWVAILYVTALVLQSFNLFSWLNSVFLVAALTFLEIYFLYNDRKTINNVS